jgi:hypothetical protein
MDEILLLPEPKKARKPQRRYKGNNAFEILGIPPSSSIKKIKRQYRELARQFHPDINPEPETHKRFEEINRAYEFIIKGGDLARLLVQCRMVEVKRKYAAQLKIIKRSHILAGMEIDPVPLNQLPNMEEEQIRDMSRLGFYLLFKCPHCKLKERCDVVTGFWEVQDIHDEMVRKALSKMKVKPHC